MKDSLLMHRKQKTSYEGYSLEGRVEPESKKKVPSEAKASTDETSSADLEYLLEKILYSRNILPALERVEKNKGSHGVDGMQVDELRPFLKEEWPNIRSRILEGKYKPMPVRRVEIPKPDGGIRLLGIPTVLDRFLQQAIAQILTDIFDPGFSDNNYGFRPGRSARDAVLKAREYINQGYKYVVDIDLEKFFDKVNHDILMHRISIKIKDKRVLKLIRSYLKSGIMEDGMFSKTSQGTPQGGPLSPLLSNIMLDDLDKLLESRGHRFVRYADDNNIYIKSKRSGLRVMESVTKFLETNLKLKVNKDKSAVGYVAKRKFLGFTFFQSRKEIDIRIHPKSIKRFKDKIRRITSRSWGISMEERIKKLNQTTIGWINYFSIAKAKSVISEIDGWIRARLRMCIWKQWKKPKTKTKNLLSLKASKEKAYEWGNTRKGYWRTAHSPILSTTMTNKYLESIKFQSLSARYLKMQLT